MLIKTLAMLAAAAAAQAVTFTVQSSGGNATSPYQYGIMYEDINNSGDAELVQNRAFQVNSYYPSNLSYWYPIGDVSLALSNLSDPLSSALPTSMQVNGGSTDTIGFWNEGLLHQTCFRKIVLMEIRLLGLPSRILLAVQWLVLHTWRV